MNWSNMLPWYQWLIFAAVPPLIFLLYFLKLRRVPLEVPSTYLWAKTVEDLHVNSLWQRLRNNMLLWLQLLAVGLLALSCFNPGCDGTRLNGDRFIFLVDRSASMSATDTPDGISRLEEAKKQICALIDELDPSDTAMVISFSDDAQVEQSYTFTKSVLKQKVRNIQQTQRASNIREALLAASGLANPGRSSDQASEIDVQVAEALNARMLIFSDGGFDKADDFLMGNLSAEYYPVGSEVDPPPNLGITAFSASDQLDSGGKVQVFARLQNSGLDDDSAAVSLYVDGELSDAQNVNVRGVNSATINFDLTANASGLTTSVPIELRIDADDCYLLDNTANTVLNPPHRVNVLVVTDDRLFFELAMTTERLQKFAEVKFESREFLESDTYRDDSALGVYDLILFDQCRPPTMPPCSTIMFGVLPPTGWSELAQLDPAPIIDVNQTHPIMFDVQMGRVNILKAIALKGPPGSLGLLDSTEGTLMAVCPRGSHEDLVIGFPLSAIGENGDTEVNTDWPRLLSFPIFIQNAVLTLGGASQFGRSRNYSPGELVQLKPRFPYRSIEVTSPEGTTKSLEASEENQFQYADTDQAGVYSVRGSDQEQVDHLFTVNLLDRQESNLEVRDNIGLGLEEIEATRQTQVARKNFWTWLVLACLGVITIEWLIFNKRVFI